MIEYSRGGEPFPRLVIDGRPVYFGDQRDSGDGQRWAQVHRHCLSGEAVVVFGGGWGWHIAGLLRYLPPSARVLVVDPPGMPALTTGGGHPLLRWTEDQRVTVWQGTADGMKQYLDRTGRRWVVLRYWPIVEPLGNFYAGWEFAVRQAAGYTYTRDYTYRIAVRRLLTDNFWQNIHCLPSGLSWRPLIASWRGVAAACVSSGPSLDVSVSWLKKQTGRTLVIAAGSGVPALQSHGIVPDIALAIDPFPCNSGELTTVLSPRSLLVTTPQVPPAVIRSHRGPLAFVSLFGRSPEGDWWTAWRDIYPDVAELQASVSVSVAAISLALFLGCRPVFLFGQDLAYAGRRHHAAGALASQWEVAEGSADDNLVWLDGQTGDKVRSTRVWEAIRRALEQFPVVCPGTGFYNLSPGGAKIAGYQDIDGQEFDRLLARAPARPGLPAAHRVGGEDRIRARQDELAAYLQVIHQQWCRLREQLLVGETPVLAAAFTAMWDDLQSGPAGGHLRPMLALPAELLPDGGRGDSFSRLSLTMYAVDSIEHLLKLVRGAQGQP
ncbi:MAG: DUF115 domain-containing protein [Negativicutes bacterium]|nr:DUF115 domain-containing protein [Negativicutes bacterium]